MKSQRHGLMMEGTLMLYMYQTRVFIGVYSTRLCCYAVGVLVDGMNYNEIRLLYMYLGRIQSLNLPDVKKWVKHAKLL